MRKKPKKKKKITRRKRTSREAESLKHAIRLEARYEQLKRDYENLWAYVEKSEERLQDMEIHVNLLTRLFTTFCIEKYGMRVGVLKRLIKRIEKEAIRDSQINHLESLYKLNHNPGKSKKSHNPKDPWDEIT